MPAITARPVEAEAFAPFGTLIHPPAHAGQREMFSEWALPVTGLRPQLHVNRVAPSRLPLTVSQVERHPHAAQIFLPLDAGTYLIVVMPSLDSGAPDIVRACAWLVPPMLGVAYRPGVWHTGIVALDRESCFSVLMWRGAANDDEMAAVSPVTVAL
ncbi:MAG: ureidoglycolate hydrolase [Acidimicrobiia bacterium]|nr:ureidoglycolate hydrolase [Acidimicrobiia bacterium]